MIRGDKGVHFHFFLFLLDALKEVIKTKVKIHIKESPSP